MKTKFVLAICALLVAVTASAQTVDEILDKNFKAQGGLDKLKALQSLRMTGKVKMGPMEVPFTQVKSRPSNYRLEFTLQGMTGVQAYDGATGWMVMPFMGKKEPEKMSADMLKDFKDEADFDGPLVDYKSKGNKVELAGKADVQGTPAYKLHVVTKESNEMDFFVDADSYLTIQITNKMKIQGQEVEQERTLGDYKDVNGLMFPFSVETHAKGKAEGGRSVTVEKIELNPAALDASMFKMPEVKAPAAPAEAPKK